MALQYGQITGKFLQSVADSSDSGSEPDLTPLTDLTIELIPGITRTVVNDSSAPYTLELRRIVCETDSNGFLVDPNGSQGCYVVATDSTDLETTDWTWTAKIWGPTVTPYWFSFLVPADSVVDLSTVIPVPPQPGTELVAWQAAVATTTAARDEAVAAAASIQPGQPNGVATLDANGVVPTTQVDATVSDLVEDSGSATAASLNATYGTVVDAAADLQWALDTAAAASHRQLVKLKPGTTYTFTDGVSWDATKVILDCQGATLDFSALSSGAAVTVFGSGSQYTQVLTGIRNAEMVGPGSSSSVTGILFNDDSSAGSGPAHIKSENVVIHGFGTGEVYRNRAYLITAENCNVYDCDIGVSGESATDGGENMRRIGGAIFNNRLAVKLANSNSMFNLIGTSLDYNEKLLEVTAGFVVLTACHVEAADYTATPITISGDGAGVRVSGGWWLLDEPIPHLLDYWVDVGTDTSFSIEGVRMNNTRTGTNTFATGLGHVSIQDAHSFGIHLNNQALHDTRSRLRDGGFEQGSIVDDIFITEDTQPITDRHNGTNIDLTLSSTHAKAGTKSLAYTKAFGAGSLSSCSIACVPVREGEMVGYRFSYRKPGTSTGSIAISYQWAKLGVNADGVLRFVAIETFGDETITFTSADTGWVDKAGPSEVRRAPGWASHFVISVSGFNWNAVGESIYFDDLNVGVIG